jgi:hypothetical protein
MEFRTGVIRPVECFQEGWELIKKDYWLFFGITAVGMLLAGFIPIIGVGTMFCGIYYCLLQKIDGRRPEFADLFKGFEYILPSLVATLAIIVPTVISMIFMYGSMIAIFLSYANGRTGRIDESAFYALFGTMIIEGVLFGLLMGVLHALIMFAYPLIVEHKLNGWEAFKLSAKAVWKNLNGVIGLIALEFVLGVIGYMGLAIGIYFVLPIMFAGVAVAYRKVFPKNDFSPANAPSFAPSPDFAKQADWR